MGQSDSPGFVQGALRRVGAQVPGVLLASALALVALEIARFTILPAVLVGLLLGMAVAPVADRPSVAPGLALSGREILRLGVALLGARVTLGEMAAIGLGAVAIAVCGLIVCLGLGFALARAGRLSRELSFLTAAAVAICGASAALAVAAVLPRTETRYGNAAATVAAITVIGTAAMIAYPFLAVAVGMDEIAAGIFYGSTLHEVVQAVGAGFTHSPLAGEIATTVKLVRVACLAPVVMLIGWWASRGGETRERPPLLPWFLMGFLAFAVLASLGVIGGEVQRLLAEASRFCLLVAIVGLGAKIAPRQLAAFGLRPILVIIGQSAILAAFALAAILAI